jgi:transcription antitermination factor NusG
MRKKTLGSGSVEKHREGHFVPTVRHEPHWYAVYTSANHEKRVAVQLGVRQVEYFLPTYESVRRWKDRRVTLKYPLFPGYVFVRLALLDRLSVLQVPGVVRLVGFNGTPCPLPDNEIDVLRQGLSGTISARPCPYWQRGRRVVVKAGPLKGLQGILVRKKSHGRLVISLDLIQRSVAVDLDELDLATL